MGTKLCFLAGNPAFANIDGFADPRRRKPVPKPKARETQEEKRPRLRAPTLSPRLSESYLARTLMGTVKSGSELPRQAPRLLPILKPKERIWDPVLA